MENTLTDMIESGSSAPDLFTFNSITGGLWEQWAARQDGKDIWKGDDIETMEEYLSKTKHLRIKTNTITYCSLVSTKLTGALHEDYCGRATFKYRVRILR
ncbi:hypothetical protein NC651_002684 [Populus alba x Populus x berolinensis]|nr:hypothetical protein NC651_002684 [Populus alba x Populus x berolinensis]